MILKKKGFLLSVMLFMLLFLSVNYARVTLASELRSFYKDDYMLEDILSKGLDPNVLLLLDVSTAMTFAPFGVMPNKSDDRSQYQRALMLKDSTYGHGMRPPRFISGDGQSNSELEETRIHGGMGVPGYILSYSRYGRDLDPSNNIIGDPNCYYTSEPSKFFLLTFKNRHLAHYDKWITENGNLRRPNFGVNSDLPSGGVVGTLTDNERREAEIAFNSLVKYIPERFVKNASGVWVPAPNFKKGPVPKDSPATEHLVPNDSRLYIMKLVLWRLTEELNSNMFSRMNVAAAKTYQDYTNIAFSGATKNALSGYGEGHRFYYGATVDFPYGNAAQYVTGVHVSKPDIEGVLVDNNFMSQWTRHGVVVDAYYDSGPFDNGWKSLSRAILFAPFNKFYRIRDSDGKIEKTEKLDNFRSWISGYEVYKTGITRPIKDELWASSLTLLSTAIYGGQNSSEGNYFPYHKGVINVHDRGGTGEPLLQFAVTSRDKAGSGFSDSVLHLDPLENSEGLPAGQAVGSVFDFFSPPPTNNPINGLDGVNFATDSVGFFPVTGSCQQNWLVIFCAGNDAVPEYSPVDAVSNLFKKTLTMRGRRFDSVAKKWEAQEYEMDSGVRTLIVGFIDPENKEPEIVKVKTDLERMARVGDPIETTQPGDKVRTFSPNPYAKPEFANDVPGLIKALNTVFKRIYAEKMGSGIPVSQPAIDDFTDPSVRIVFGASYRINPLDQWDAWLSKFRLEDNRPPIKLWEVNEGMAKLGLSRKLFTSIGVSGSVERVTASNLKDHAGIPARANDFYKWFCRFNNSDQQVGELSGVLGDMVNSGITVVGGPKHISLTSIAEIKNREAVVYVQTNRGVLHAFNYLTGHEIWGFVPPGIFGSRIKNLKFDENNEWIDGNGYTRVRSNPMVLLDGLLNTQDVVDGLSVNTLLTGYLGRGGNGFYTMNISYMDAINKEPRFEWAIENIRYDNTVGGGVVRRWGRAASSLGNYNYSQLGHTIVPGVYFTPIIGLLGGEEDTIGVLPGGLGYRLGRQNDNQGKAFYFFNPTDGSILRTINTRATGFRHPSNNDPGMGVSPIIYRENSQRKTIEFYTVDSDGNIIWCDTSKGNFYSWELQSIFQFITVGQRMFPYEYIAPVTQPNRPIVIPKKMVLGRSRNGYVWLFGGTSDINGPGSFANDSHKIINDEQYLFGLNTNNILSSSSLNSSGISPRSSNVRKMPYYIDPDLPAEYGVYGMAYPGKNPNTGINYGMDDYGWVMRLRPKLAQFETEAEYLSADPFLFNSVLYLATFIPRSSSQSAEVCANVGVGKLYVLDPTTGHSLLDKPAIVLENIKIAGLSGNPKENRLTLSLKELKTGGLRAVYSNFSSVSDLGSGLIDIKAPAGEYDGSNNEPDFEEIVPHIQYWNESF